MGKQGRVCQHLHARTLLLDTFKPEQQPLYHLFSAIKGRSTCIQIVAVMDGLRKMSRCTDA